MNQSSGAEAWLLSFNKGVLAAIGERELQHIAHSPAVFPIPLCPFYCNEVMIWNNLLLPVIDLASWVTDGRLTCRSPLLGIVAYQPHNQHSTSYAGLRLDSAPRRLSVQDNQACALPEDMPAWRKIAVSCFIYQKDIAVPVLDLPSIFSNKPERALHYPGLQ